MSFYTKRVKDTCHSLGKFYRGYDIEPSDKIFYGEFQYRIRFQGNMYHYDITFMSDLNTLLMDELWHYRIQNSAKNINVYLHDKGVLDKIIDQYQHTDYIEGISGPLDDDHLESLLDSKTDYVYRNKYWYDTYPIKVFLYRGWDHRDIEGREIIEFIKGSFEEYRLHDTYSNNWYHNYLWLTQEEYDKSFLFLKLSYGDVIEKVQKVKLLEN